MRRLGIGDWLVLGVVALTFAAGIAFYGRLPEEMAIHWSLDGTPDRYAPRSIAVFAAPVVSLVMFVYSRLPGTCRRNTGVGARVVLPIILLVVEAWVVWHGMR